jgi:hypothetical protein
MCIAVGLVCDWREARIIVSGRSTVATSSVKPWRNRVIRWTAPRIEPCVLSSIDHINTIDICVSNTADQENYGYLLFEVAKHVILGWQRHGEHRRVHHWVMCIRSDMERLHGRSRLDTARSSTSRVRNCKVPGCLSGGGALYPTKEVGGPLL